MPLPLIIPIAIGAAGLLGIGKTVKAVADNSKADDINNDAQEILNDAKDSLEKARSAVQNSLQKFGEKKVNVYGESIKPFLQVMGKIKNIHVIQTNGFNECFNCDPQQLKNELEAGCSLADSVASGAFGSTVAGAMVGFGAYGSVATFATASTGAAISGLSGAAATNATLAWLGGGAISAGGLGIAGGTMVLGTLVAGPALAVMGFVMGSKASANLDCAYSNLAQAEKAREELGMVTSACKGISSRVSSFISVMSRLNILMMMGNVRLTQIVTNEGVDYSRYDDDAKDEVAKIVSTAKALKTMLDIALLKKDGSLNDEAEIALREAKNYLTLNQGI